MQIRTASGGAIDPATVFDPNWINPGQNRLPITRAAVAQTLAGNADTIISIAADSILKGWLCSSFYTTASAVLASLLTAAGYPAQAEARYGPTASGNADPQLSVGSGWNGGGLQSAQFWINSTTTNPLALTTPIVITGYVAEYYDGVSGTFQVTVDGSVVDTITTTGTDVTIKKSYSVSSGTHALGIVRTAGTVAFMGWGNLRNSAVKKIIINNLSAPGALTADWATAGSSNLQAVLSLTQPHLVIGNPLTNDWLTAVAPSTSSLNLQALASAISPVSDFLPIYPVPSSTSLASVAAQQATGAQLYSLAVARNFIGLDLTKRWVSWANVSTAFFGGNTIHPNDAGHADMAAAIFALLKFCFQF